jgi:hypothetical protein
MTNTKIKHMKKYIIIPLVIIIALLAYSCEKTVDNIKLPKTTPKLVVYSYISPTDTLITVSVSKSVPIFDNSNNTPENVTDASVVISDENGNNATLLYDNIAEVYIIPAAVFPIIGGKSYKLKVSTPDGLAVDASCTVPADNNTSLQLIDIDSNVNQNNEKEYFAQLSFKDTPGIGDYYRVCGMVKLVNYDNQGQIYTTYEEFYMDLENECVEDKDKDGSTFSFTLKYYHFEDEFGDVIDSFTFFLLHTDKDYFEFHNSIYNYQGDNPFSEPSLIYSNMNGGYGVFAAYNPFQIFVDR